MGVSMIDVQRDIILSTIKNITRGDWKVLVVDETTRKLIDNVVKEDDILNLHITNIEQIEDRRPMNKETDAIYILSPLPHIFECIIDDFERHRYRAAFLVWTALPHQPSQERLDRIARERIRMFKVLQLEFHPRESHLVTFKDPWSFPTLYHPMCNDLVQKHMKEIAQKVVGVCVALGEYPIIRYYRPKNATHEARVLCTHLARIVQEQLDMYAQYNPDFPPPSNRPRGALYITDRSMDIFAPLLHEFTYQAMAHDLLDIREGDKVTYKTVLEEGEPGAEAKEMEISDKDKVWVENRHRHMKDTIEKLMGDFKKFIDDNPHFTRQDSANATGRNGLNAIKDMIAGLPQFQEMKEAYSLHLSMAQECMNTFERNKLPDLASVEQCLATGLDEDYRKPKNTADQVVRTLDEPDVTPSDRLRLITLYLLYRNGLLPADLSKLLAHAQLAQSDAGLISNLELLGARVSKPLKDKTEPPPPLFPRRTTPPPNAEEYALSRFTTVVHDLLEEHVRGTLDPTVFPYTKPHTDAPETPQENISSLRSAKPTWAKSKLSSVEPRQRVIVFLAGGATYSESRACYEISEKTSRDIFLVTSHMLTPRLFVRQVGDLGADRRVLNLPYDRPPVKAPKHIFEREEVARPMGQQPGRPVPGGLPPKPGPGPAPPTQGLAGMTLNSRTPAAGGQGSHLQQQNVGGKVKEEKKKKKHHFFSSKH